MVAIRFLLGRTPLAEIAPFILIRRAAALARQMLFLPQFHMRVIADRLTSNHCAHTSDDEPH
jgi:hypothetical protein